MQRRQIASCQRPMRSEQNRIVLRESCNAFQFARCIAVLLPASACRIADAGMSAVCTSLGRRAQRRRISPRRPSPRSSATRRSRSPGSKAVVPGRDAGGKPGYVRVNDVRMAYAGKEGRAGERARPVHRQGRQGPGHRNRRRARAGRKRPESGAASMRRSSRSWKVTALTPQAAAARCAQQRLDRHPRRLCRRSQTGRRCAPRREPGAEAQWPVGRARPAVELGRRAASGIRRWTSPTRRRRSRKTELTAEELALGPGDRRAHPRRTRHLWHDDAAQQRVNRIGRWMASHTTRPELPWTFGVIDTPGDQRVRRARRLRTDDARPVRPAGRRWRSRRRARPRDQPRRAARPLQRDPQAGDARGDRQERCARARSMSAAGWRGSMAQGLRASSMARR